MDSKRVGSKRVGIRHQWARVSRGVSGGIEACSTRECVVLLGALEIVSRRLQQQCSPYRVAGVLEPLASLVGISSVAAGGGGVKMEEMVEEMMDVEVVEI